MPFMLFMVIKNRGKKIELSISNPKDAARRFSEHNRIYKFLGLEN